MISKTFVVHFTFKWVPLKQNNRNGTEISVEIFCGNQHVICCKRYIFGALFPKTGWKTNPWQTSFHSMKIFFISHNTSQDIKISYCQPYILVYFTVVLIPVHF